MIFSIPVLDRGVDAPLEPLEQYAAFELLSHHFSDVLESLEVGDVSDWIHPTWEETNARMRTTLTPAPPLNFLRIQEIAWMMFVHARGAWLAQQRAAVEEAWGPQTLTHLLTENVVGGPPLVDVTPVTSHNSIHHLYHLTHYQQTTGQDLRDLPVVVEWGGGYGNLVKIHRRIVPTVTNIVIDTPVFTALQWLYLSSVLGPAQVNVVRSADDELLPGRVNLVALPFARELDVKADLFVSTWALSESAQAAQEWVSDDMRWFGARRLLLAVQHDDEQWQTASTVRDNAVRDGARVHRVAYREGSDYIFR